MPRTGAGSDSVPRVNWPKEVAQNQMMRLGFVQRRAQARHRTGGSGRDGDLLLERLRTLVPFPLQSTDVLEVGPGQSSALMRSALPVVGSYSAVDVHPYLNPDEVAELGIDYRIGDGVTLDWPDNTFDVAWNNSVMEHVADPAPLLDEIARVLKPGGVLAMAIDLTDHLVGGKSPDRVFHFLKYSDWQWAAMANRRGSWSNRLRASDWKRLLSEAGFEIVAERDHGSEAHDQQYSLDDLRAVPYLNSYSDEDLLTWYLHVGCRTSESPASGSTT